MPNKQFAINTVASTLNLIIQFAINFLLTGYLVRVIGSTAYGYFTLACTIVGYATIISNALNSMSARFVGYEYFNNNIKGAIRYYSSVLYSDIIFVFIISVPAIILILGLEKYIVIPSELIDEVKKLFFLVFLNLCISIGGAVFSIVYVIKNRLDLSSIRTMVSNILRALLLLAMYGTMKPSIVYLGYASIGASLFILITNIFTCRRMLPEIVPQINVLSGKAIKEIAASGMWNSFNQLSIILLHGLDLLICNQAVGPLAMGYLSIAGTMPNAVTMCVSTFGYLFTPQLLEHYSHKKYEMLVNDLKNSIKFMTVISSIPIGFLIGFGYQFYSLWTPDTDIKHVYLLSICVILPNFTGSAINSVNYLYTVVNKVKWPAIVLSITGVLNILFIFLLLKTTNLGIYAIVLVSAILGLVRNIVFNAPYAAHCIGQPYHIFWNDILKSFSLLTAISIICCLISRLITIDSWLKLIAIGGTTTLTCGIIISFIILTKKQRSYMINKLLRR